MDKQQNSLGKRGRGRTKKYSTTESDNNATQNSNMTEFRPNDMATQSQDLQSSTTINERKTGRKRKNPIEDENEAVVQTVLTKSEDEEGKRTRRSERLCNRLDGFKLLEEDKEESHNDSNNDSPTRKTLRLHVDDKTPPKKRGRKAKVSMDLDKQEMETIYNPSKKTAVAQHVNNNANETSLVVPKRSQRRIKPTPKILENDELRYEFETKNVVRMTATHNWSAEDQQQQKHHSTTPTHQIVGSQNEGSGGSTNTNTTASNTNSNSKQKSEKMDYSLSNNVSHPTGSSHIKKKLFPCPDIKKFLHEIKTCKWNLNRSPEDKKLSKKQQRKLAKQKDKYFEKMGLRRTHSNDTSDNDSLSDNAEFVPTTRVQVGKPSVTLRGRSKDINNAAANGSSASLVVNNQANTASANVNTQKSNSSSSTPPQTRRTQRQKSVTAACVTNNDKVVELKALNASVVVANQLADVTKTNNNNNNNVTATLRDDLLTLEQKKSCLDCLCHTDSNIRTPMIKETQYCWAIDNIDEEKVGCSNQLTGTVLPLFRASKRAVYMVLCEDHQKRLKAHNSCPSCGIFCTQVRLTFKVFWIHSFLRFQYKMFFTLQGKFVLCKQRHFFHAACAQRIVLSTKYDSQQPKSTPTRTLVLKCPHCGMDTAEKTSTITMRTPTVPIFQATQQPPLNTPAQTVFNSLTGHINETSASSTWSTNVIRPYNNINYDKLIPESVMNVVTARGRTLQTRTANSTEFTTKDMYYAIKNDDLERVAEILGNISHSLQ